MFVVFFCSWTFIIKLDSFWKMNSFLTKILILISFLIFTPLSSSFSDVYIIKPCHFNSTHISLYLTVSLSVLVKEQRSFSWDWGPSFPSMGLWKGVRLEAFDVLQLIQVSSVPLYSMSQLIFITFCCGFTLFIVRNTVNRDAKMPFKMWRKKVTGCSMSFSVDQKIYRRLMANGGRGNYKNTRNRK